MSFKCVIKDLFVQIVTILLLNTTCNHLFRIHNLASRKKDKHGAKKRCKIAAFQACACTFLKTWNDAKSPNWIVLPGYNCTF